MLFFILCIITQQYTKTSNPKSRNRKIQNLNLKCNILKSNRKNCNFGLPRTEAEKIQQKSHCTIIDDDYSEIEEKPKEKVTPTGCASACRKYKQCAGFGQGVGKKGMNEAYNTCVNQACPSWSQKTLRCMQKVHINSPMDCAALTFCGLAEYVTKGFYDKAEDLSTNLDEVYRSVKNNVIVS